jgi:hypothetical protein
MEIKEFLVDQDFSPTLLYILEISFYKKSDKAINETR